MPARSTAPPRLAAYTRWPFAFTKYVALSYTPPARTMSCGTDPASACTSSALVRTASAPLGTAYGSGGWGGCGYAAAGRGVAVGDVAGDAVAAGVLVAAGVAVGARLCVGATLAVGCAEVEVGTTTSKATVATGVAAAVAPSALIAPTTCAPAEAERGTMNVVAN